MDFDYSSKVQELQARLTRFMEENVYPAEPAFAAEVLANRQSGNAWIPTQVIESLKAKARAAGLWNLFLPESDHGAGLTNLEYAPLCEIMGRSCMGARGVQLLRAGHRQHGSAGALRHAGAEEAMAGAAARGRDPLVLRHDRAGGRLVRRDQHRGIDPRATATTTSSTDASGGPPARPIRAARSSSSWARPTRPIRTATSSSRMILVPLDTPGVKIVRVAAGVRLRRRAARPRRESMFENVRVPVVQYPAGRRPRLRDRAGPPRPGPHPSLHAPDRPGRARAGEDVPARAESRGVRPAGRRPDGDAGAHRRSAHRHRPGAAAGAARPRT